MFGVSLWEENLLVIPPTRANQQLIRKHEMKNIISILSIIIFLNCCNSSNNNEIKKVQPCYKAYDTMTICKSGFYKFSHFQMKSPKYFHTDKEGESWYNNSDNEFLFVFKPDITFMDHEFKSTDLFDTRNKLIVYINGSIANSYTNLVWRTQRRQLLDTSTCEYKTDNAPFMKCYVGNKYIFYLHGYFNSQDYYLEYFPNGKYENPDSLDMFSIGNTYHSPGDVWIQGAKVTGWNNN
ncbi:MAG: hypothetical protein NTX03_09450 [Bacteroidetes bacterium]|nr:hypothetical protein [Bacteroidota bacterium]